MFGGGFTPPRSVGDQIQCTTAIGKQIQYIDVDPYLCISRCMCAVTAQCRARPFGAPPIVCRNRPMGEFIGCMLSLAIARAID